MRTSASHIAGRTQRAAGVRSGLIGVIASVLLALTVQLVPCGISTTTAFAQQGRERELQVLRQKIQGLLEKRDFAAVLPLALRALEITKAARGVNHIDYAAALYDVGNALIQLNRDAESERYFWDCISTILKLDPKLLQDDEPDHPYATLFAYAHANLGKALAKRNDSKNAQIFLDRACKMMSQAVLQAKDFPKTDALITCRNSLATLIKNEDYKYADYVAGFLIDIAEPTYNGTFARLDALDDIISFLIRKYEELGLLDRAGRLAFDYADKLAEDEGKRGPEETSEFTLHWAQYPRLQDLYHHASELLIRAGRGTEAYAASTRSVYYYYARYLKRPDLRWSKRPMRLDRDSEQGSFPVGVLENHLDAAWLAHAQGQGGDTGVEASAFRAAQWSVTNSASLSIGMMAARAPMASLAGAREWQDMKRQLDKMLRSIAGKSDKDFPDQFVALSKFGDEMGALLAQIRAQVPDFYDLVYPKDLSLSEVQNLVSPDETLIFFYGAGAATFAWGITATEVKWIKVDISSSQIAEHVAALRCGLDAEQWQADASIRDCMKLLNVGPVADPTAAYRPQVLPFDAGRAFDLYTSLLKPFEGLAKGKRLILVPYASLSGLPFNVMVTSPPPTRIPTKLADYRGLSWLGRSTPMMVLPSVSALKALRKQAQLPAGKKPFLGIGNPLLDGDTGRNSVDAGRAALAKSLQRCPERKRLERVALGAGRTLSFPSLFRGAHADAGALRAWPPLPESADELCEVGKLLGATDDDILLGRGATEARLKELSRTGKLAEYAVLNFAIHGATAGQVDGVAEPGLILTPPDGTDPSTLELDDGFLTASEIAAMRLNSDWVVLSACNTAAGSRGDPEALSGLAQSFFYAGARALLVSHWVVYSDAAVKLTTRAFAELGSSQGIGRADAVRRSISDLIANGDSLEAHPSFWAPFVLVGEGGARR